MSEDPKKRIEIGQYTLNSRNKNAPDPQKIVDTDRRIQEKNRETVSHIDRPEIKKDNNE